MQCAVKLENLIKISLDELRMQMLGVQVLFGFQFQGLFQAGFRDVSEVGRRVDALGLILLVMVLGCLVAVPCQHRIVDRGMATVRLQRTATRFAEFALMPFALGIGCALFVAVGRSFGDALGAVAAAAATLVALAAWYGLGLVLRWSTGGAYMETDMKSSATPLHTRIDQMLTEARVILPGAQALLGFQLIVMMTPAFDELTRATQIMHLLALACVLSAVLLLIAPAAVHRIAFGGHDDPQAYAVGARLLTWTLLPLALGIGCDFYVAMTRLLEDEVLPKVYAAVIFVALMTLWYLVPLMLKRTPRAHQ
jgi:uncharacterized protein DUF6328